MSVSIQSAESLVLFVPHGRTLLEKQKHAFFKTLHAAHGHLKQSHVEFWFSLGNCGGNCDCPSACGALSAFPARTAQTTAQENPQPHRFQIAPS
jgi:hypothetical protein